MCVLEINKILHNLGNASVDSSSVYKPTISPGISLAFNLGKDTEDKRAHLLSRNRSPLICIELLKQLLYKVLR